MEEIHTTENEQNAWERYLAALPKDTILAGKYIIKRVYFFAVGCGVVFISALHPFDDSMETEQFENFVHG